MNIRRISPASIWSQAADGGLDTLEGLATALRAAVEMSGRDAQLALIRAHPISRAGCAPAPLTRGIVPGTGLCRTGSLQRRRTGGIPAFGTGPIRRRSVSPSSRRCVVFTRAQILEEFRRRAANDSATEFATALSEIHKIARQRLADMT